MIRRLTITGRVQGVFYRDWFVSESQSRGLAGWVRNRRDGSVEAVIDGAPAAVADMTRRAAEGSPASNVDAVLESEAAVGEPLHGFVRRPTV